MASSGDLVELDAVHGDALHLALQRRLQVPGDGLALAVGVGGQVHLRRAFGLGLQLFDHILLFGGDHVARLKIMFDVHAHAVGRQVADVAHRSLHGVAPAQETAHRARLGRRLDDDHFGTAGLALLLRLGGDGVGRRVQALVGRRAAKARHLGAALGADAARRRAACSPRKIASAEAISRFSLHLTQ